MKRLLGILLMLCLLLSCTLAFTACGGFGGGMSESEWGAALDLSNVTKVSCTIDDGDVVRDVQYDGENYSETVRSPESEQPTSAVRWIKDGDRYVAYHQASDGYWDGTEVTARDFSEYVSVSRPTYFYNYAVLFPHDAFTLNGETGVYEAAEVSPDYGGAIGDFGPSYFDVKISFENKRVTRIEYSDGKITRILTFAYDGFVISAPADIRPTGPIATETAWNTALDLSAFDNVSIVQTQGNTTVSTFLWDGTNLLVEVSGVGILVVKEGDSYYKYMKMSSSAWGERMASNEIEYNAYVTAYLHNAEIYPFEEFQYNPTTEMYEADAIDQTGDGVTVTVTDVKIRFADNKPDTISYSYHGGTTVMTYTYTDVTIDLPASDPQ